MTETLNSEVLLIDNETGELLNGKSGAEIQFLKEYGCGIDCHSKFLQISVLVRKDQSIYEYRNQFDTDWDSVVKARDWVLSVLETRASQPADVSEGLHYCIESTSSYHVVCCKAWGGKPIVINPSIAKAGRKKTDVLDALQLARADISGIWPESYIPPLEVDELRILIAERMNFNRLATRISNRINNMLLKLGYTNGRSGSVTKNDKVRRIILDAGYCYAHHFSNSRLNSGFISA